MLKSFKPEDILPGDQNYVIGKNGIQTRKGTAAAAFQNASILSSPTSTLSEKEEAKKTLVELAPSLIAVGMHEHVIWKNSIIQKIMEEAAKNY